MLRTGRKPGQPALSTRREARECFRGDCGALGQSRQSRFSRGVFRVGRKSGQPALSTRREARERFRGDCGALGQSRPSRFSRVVFHVGAGHCGSLVIEDEDDLVVQGPHQQLLHFLRSGSRAQERSGGGQFSRGGIAGKNIDIEDIDRAGVVGEVAFSKLNRLWAVPAPVDTSLFITVESFIKPSAC